MYLLFHPCTSLNFREFASYSAANDLQTMANSALRPLLSPHLTLRSYVFLRIFIPLLAYIPLSFSFAMISLPFHVPFNTKYTEAQGFFLFWIICYILMGGLGLATEFAIGALTIRFAPFLLLAIVSNVVSFWACPAKIWFR